MKQPLGFSFVMWLFDDMDKYYCKLYLWKKKKYWKLFPKKKVVIKQITIIQGFSLA